MRLPLFCLFPRHRRVRSTHLAGATAVRVGAWNAPYAATLRFFHQDIHAFTGTTNDEHLICVVSKYGNAEAGLGVHTLSTFALFFFVLIYGIDRRVRSTHLSGYAHYSEIFDEPMKRALPEEKFLYLASLRLCGSSFPCFFQITKKYMACKQYYGKN